MNRILNIIVKIFIVTIIIQTIFIPTSNASYWGDIFSIGDEFLEDGAKETVIDENKMKSISDVLYNVLFSLGIAASVIVGAVLGIQFMWGSIEQKAKVKEQLIPYIIGCVVVFGAFGIWELVVNIGDELFAVNTSTSTTYTKDDDGKLYCDNCGDELINIEQRRGKCSQCGYTIKGI